MLRRLSDTLAYGLGQSARIGWYTGQYLAALPLTSRLDLEDPTPPEAYPDRADLLRDIRALCARDLSNIRKRRYPRPDQFLAAPGRLVGDAMRFFADLPSVHLKRREQRFRAPELDPVGPHGDLPRYYLRNFHFQTDGYLSERSAALYDYQVETLFMGSADAMRRQVLPPLTAALGSGKGTTLLDIATGTGRFLQFVAKAVPEARVIGLDLSPAYINQARAAGHDPRLSYLQGNAEALPFADGEIDAALSIFLFHELPLPAQRNAAREIGRVLRPGGIFVFLDSLQKGDKPEYDILLERFPKAFHEPFYRDYTRLDLARLFGDAGLVLVESERVFLSKRLVFRKPPY